MSEEEFELVPLTPVRRLEKEIQQLKEQVKGGDQNALVTQVVEILKMNQTIVDQLTTKQSDLIVRLTETNEKIARLCNAIDMLVDELSVATEEEAAPAEAASSEKLDKIIEQNAALINSLTVLGKEMGRVGDKK